MWVPIVRSWIKTERREVDAIINLLPRWGMVSFQLANGQEIHVRARRGQVPD